jgi:hypothetical protein
MSYQEVTSLSHENSLLQKLQEKAVYKDPKWFEPSSPDPRKQGRT